jgi:hypothetical protein
MISAENKAGESNYPVCRTGCCIPAGKRLSDPGGLSAVAAALVSF